MKGEFYTINAERVDKPDLNLSDDMDMAILEAISYTGGELLYKTPNWSLVGTTGPMGLVRVLISERS